VSDADRQAAVYARIDAMQRELDALRSEVAGLAEARDAQGMAIHALVADVGGLRADLAGVRSAVGHLAADLAGVRSTLDRVPRVTARAGAVGAGLPGVVLLVVEVVKALSH